MNLKALKSPPFRAYLISVHVSLLGFWAQRVIIGWLAWNVTGSASFVGLIAFLNLSPSFFGGPLFGVLADRVDVRRGSVLTYSGAFCASLVFAIVAFAGWLVPTALAAFALLIGTIQATNHPIRMSLTPRLAPVKDMPSVIALTSVNFNISRLTGPVIGGVLIQTLDASQALLITALAHLPVIIVLCFVRARARSGSVRPAGEGYLASLKDGFRYAMGVRLIRLSMMLSGLCALAGRAVLDTLPLLADGVYARGPTGLGLMTAAAGAGALGASLALVLTRAQRAGEVPLIAQIMAVLSPILVALLGVVNDFNIAVFLIIAIGFTVTIVAIMLQSLIQMQLDDAYRGRVMSFWSMVTIGGASMGAMMMGALGDLAGILNAQIIVGSAFLCLVLICLVRIHHSYQDYANQDRPSQSPANQDQAAKPQ